MYEITCQDQNRDVTIAYARRRQELVDGLVQYEDVRFEGRVSLWPADRPHTVIDVQIRGDDRIAVRSLHLGRTWYEGSLAIFLSMLRPKMAAAV